MHKLASDVTMEVNLTETSSNPSTFEPTAEVFPTSILLRESPLLNIANECDVVRH